MMEVADSLAYLRTRFHTLITSPQVVSTIWQPRSLICCRIDNSVPNAGTMTTSSGWRSEISACLFFGQIFDAERRDLLIDLRVVNDLPDDKKTAILEHFARRVG